jgi:hypothetical protein
MLDGCGGSPHAGQATSPETQQLRDDLEIASGHPLRSRKRHS